MMTAFTLALLILRELAFIATGVLLCRMGFILFLKGVDAGGAEEFSLGTYIKLKGGGPGIVFVTLGAAVIIYSIATAGRLEGDELEALVDLDRIEQGVKD
jgi:hypothetical protein